MSKKDNTNLTYRQIDGHLYPNLQISNESETDKKVLGRYGRMALNYLRNHHPQRFLILQIQGDLMKIMSEVEQEALSKMEALTAQLLRLHPMPQTDDTLERTRHLNQMKATAEELTLNDIVFKPR